MKTVRILTVTILCLCLAFALAACGKSLKIKLSFIVDGEVYATVNTERDAVIAMPDDPVKEGKQFDGWYWDEGTWKQPFTANSLMDAPLSSNMNVYAKWKGGDAGTGSSGQSTSSPDAFTVTFNTADGTAVAPQTVEKGATVRTPANPTRKGYNFMGWDTDLSAPVTRDLTVTAQWQIVTYTVRYELGGGTNAAGNPETYTVEDDVVLSAPTRGTDGFLGWFLPSGQAVEQLTGLTGNLTLTARWGDPDKWELIGEELAGISATDRSFKIEMSSYGDVEKRSKNSSFLAGPDSITNGSTPMIEQLVYQRNAAAKQALGTTVSYVYWDNAWGQQASRIKTVVQSSASDAPTVFVNMIYDLSLATLDGCFKDVWSIKDSYFDFDDYGWMSEWMDDLSFTGDRAYILGGDYFLDLYRAMMVLPFNVEMMNDYAAILAPALFGGALGQNETMSERFFRFVEAGNWTWDALGKLSAAVWTDVDGDVKTSQNDILGIIVDGYGGTAASAFIYSSGENLTETFVKNGQMRIRYPSDPTSLSAIFDAVTSAFARKGALVTKDSTTSASGLSLHNTKFADDEVLFAGPRTLGSLEEAVFQNMSSVFSVVPFPKVSASKAYRTVIHNIGDAGAINVNANPRKARVVSAYLQYCTENSSTIRHEFLDLYTKYETFSYSYWTDRMIDLISGSIAGLRDKAVEDLMNNTDAVKKLRWHAMMKDYKTGAFLANGSYIENQYASAVSGKQTRLDSILDTWYTLPKVQIDN